MSSLDRSILSEVSTYHVSRGPRGPFLGSFSITKHAYFFGSAFSQAAPPEPLAQSGRYMSPREPILG